MMIVYASLIRTPNPTFNPDSAKVRSRLILRVCRAWHVTMAVEVRQPGFRRAEG